jgi:hypothetical protein
LPADETDEIDFYTSIYHSAGVVGINTSAFLDAVLINKPIFSVLIDRYSNTQVNAQHFQNLIDTNVIYLCKDTKSMLDSVQSVNESNDYLSAARVKFSKKFVWPNEVSASEYVAQKYFPRRNE